MKVLSFILLSALGAFAQPAPDSRYSVAYQDGLRALHQDALLSARASFIECLAVRPANPDASTRIATIDAKLRARQRFAAVKRYWPTLGWAYGALLSISLFFGLRREQKAHNKQ